MAQYIMNHLTSLLHTLTSCMSCFPGSTVLKINNRRFKISRLLGEGGFSYVYLVQDTSNEALYALKKIRCPFGQESVSLAMKEVEAYALFYPHPNIIQRIDYCISSDRSDPGAKTVYIVLPYYRRGNLQDIINANLINHTKFPEKQLMKLFLGMCKALKAMHYYGGQGELRDAGNQKAKRSGGQATQADQETSLETDQRRGRQADRESDPDSEQQKPLIHEDVTIQGESFASDNTTAYAHRDIKPGNIMIDDNGEQPILMDFGSVAPSPILIESRSQALEVQDTAAEYSTMPYRAPELFDVKTGSTIDTKVDIWSLGCTLFACLVGKSPFEMRSDETGGSLSICVLSGDWRFPDEVPGGHKTNNNNKSKSKSNTSQIEDSQISDNIRDVVRKCLKVEPAERPDVNELIDIVDDIISKL